jgi:hypothetical protein
MRDPSGGDWRPDYDAAATGSAATGATERNAADRLGPPPVRLRARRCTPTRRRITDAEDLEGDRF